MVWCNKIKKKISITISEKTLQDIDSIIDNIYVRNRSQAIELLINNALGENKVAVILSGGPEEDIKISEKEYRITAKVNGTALIETLITKLREHGFKSIYLIAREKVINKVFSIVQNGSKYGVNIEYVEEKESRGTADSLKLIKGKIKTNFLVVFGDVFFEDLNLQDLWDKHIKKKGITTLVLTTTLTPAKKGIVKLEGSKILEFVQKPKKSDVYLGFSSIFITLPELLEYAGDSLENDVFPYLAEKGLLNGYLTTSKIIKVHSKHDRKKF